MSILDYAVLETEMELMLQTSCGSANYAKIDSKLQEQQSNCYSNAPLGLKFFKLLLKLFSYK